MLQEGMVEQIGARATSIMIVGSYVENLSHDQSDIDLVILCNNPENRKEIKKILSSKSLMHDRPSLDCKIFTESEFRRAKTSDQHFFLWSSLQHSICLHGRNISKEIKLNLNLVVNNLWNIIKQIEEVYRLLDSHVQFSGCWYQQCTS